MPDRVTFVGGTRGTWRVERVTTMRGRNLAPVTYLDILPRVESDLPLGSVWALRGIVEEERYTTPPERQRLRSVQPNLGRPTSTRAALLPIRKSPGWWSLPMSERRAIFEERSHHIATGLEFLPAVARRLYQSRGLGEPFDFLTWFEFTPNDSDRFDQLVCRLRETEEWDYVEREVEIRLVLTDALRVQGVGSSTGPVREPSVRFENEFH